MLTDIDTKQYPMHNCKNCGKSIPMFLQNDYCNSCFRGNDFLGNNRTIDMTHTDPSVSDYHYAVQKLLNEHGYYTDINSNGVHIEVRNNENKHIGFINGLSGDYDGKDELFPFTQQFKGIRFDIPFRIWRGKRRG